MPDHGKLFLDLREELRRGRKSSSQYEGPMPKNLRSRDPKWVMDKVLEDKWKALLLECNFPSIMIKDHRLHWFKF